MQRYTGPDVHAASSTLAVISQAGKRLRTAVAETKGRALVEASRMIPGNEHLWLEEGTRSADWGQVEGKTTRTGERLAALISRRYGGT